MTGFMLVAAVALFPQVRAAAPSTPAAALPAVKSVSFGGSSAASGGMGLRGGTITGGQEAVLRVELTGPAPCVEHCGGVSINGKVGGWMPVDLTTTNAAQIPVQRLLVNTGETFGEVKFVTTPVTANIDIMVTAQSAGSAAQRGMLTILTPVLRSLVIDKSNVMSGEVVKATATFSGPPASANAVKFTVQTTNSTVIKVPPTVALAVGTTVIVFDVASQGVEQEQTAQFVVTYLDKILPAQVTVRAATLVKIANVFPCCDNPFWIALDGRPPSKGALVVLKSSDTSRIRIPPSVTLTQENPSVQVTAQSTPGNKNDEVPITASYNGETKHYKVYSRKIVKPDLTYKSVLVIDRFGNVITAAADGEPVKACVTILSYKDDSWPEASNIPIPNSVFRFSYKTLTGQGTSVGRDIDLPVVFAPGSYNTPVTHCVLLPGLAPGAQHDVKLVLDFRNDVVEPNEDLPSQYAPTSNNLKDFKIKRPATP